MGRFEDLVEQAEAGDLSALATLKEEFSGSSLREKAESADTYKEQYEKNLPLIRQAKVNNLLTELGDDAKGINLSADDFKDVDPEKLTLDMVKDKAKSVSDAAQESRLATAKASGFDTVEEFDAAMASVKEQQDRKRSEMEAVGGGATSSGGQPSGSTGTTEDVAKEAFEAAKKEGKADDWALADAVGASIDKQLAELQSE